MSIKKTFEQLQHNLNRLIKHKNISVGELARRTGAAPSTINRLMNSSDGNPTLESLLALAHFFDISVSQFIGEQPLDFDAIRHNTTVSAHYVTYIPSFTWDTLKNHQSSVSETSRIIATQKSISKQGFAITLEASNLTHFNQRGLIIVEPTLEPHNGCYVVANKLHAFSSIKRYIIEDGIHYLQPLLEGLSLFPLTPEYNIVGVIIDYHPDYRL